jgi:hypothetical protein
MVPCGTVSFEQPIEGYEDRLLNFSQKLGVRLAVPVNEQWKHFGWRG